MEAMRGSVALSACRPQPGWNGAKYSDRVSATLVQYGPVGSIRTFVLGTLLTRQAGSAAAPVSI
jgi:hypothetical protein